MVIFGAGASYDSDVERPAARDPLRGARPPLAAQLVDPSYRATANRYPASITVLDYLRENISSETPDDLETILARFADRADDSLACQQQLVAFRFYLCEVISDATNRWLSGTHGLTTYLTVVSRLAEWQERSGERIQLVTFNYDTLLEDAVSRVLPDWTFTSFGDYVKRTDWGLLKLHGSTDWSRIGESTDAQGLPNAQRALALGTKVHDGQLPYAWGSALQAREHGTIVPVPALAVPMGDKKTFECEPIHLEAFRSTVPAIDRLLVCGWRAAETHAVAILSHVNPGLSLGIVAGSAADVSTVEGNLGDVRRKANLVMTQESGMAAFATDMRDQLAPLLAPR